MRIRGFEARRNKREQGAALIVSVFILVLIGAIAILAIEQAGEERASAGRKRASTRALNAADAGIQVALNRISQSPPDLSAFSVDLGSGRLAQSRTRADSTPQPMAQVGVGPPPDGFGITVGGGGFVNEIFLANVTATSPDGATAQLQTKIGRLTPTGGGL